MNYQDSSSDDVPYLPPEQFQQYQQNQHGDLIRPSSSQDAVVDNGQSYLDSNSERRRGRSQFTEDEIQELDSPTPMTNVGSNLQPTLSASTVPRTAQPYILRSSNDRNSDHNTITSVPYPNSEDTLSRSKSYDISWGRRVLGLLMVVIPALLFSVAAHFVDWSMSDFQLFSASFFIFQGIFWPSFGILLADLFCVSKRHEAQDTTLKGCNPAGSQNSKGSKWIIGCCIVAHSNLVAATIIFQLISIQRLNISASLALSFGFDVIVIFIRYICERKRCSLELMLLTVVSYCGYAVVAIPAFTSNSNSTKNDTAVGVGASLGVMLLCIPASFLLSHLRKNNVSDSVIGTSFAIFGCFQSLITKEIMGSNLTLRLEGRSIGWAAGLIAVVFLGTIFLFLETRFSALIWQRDDDRPRRFSSITRTRIAVFILSCLWELSRQGFRDSTPDPFDIGGGFLVILSFLLSGGFEAWYKTMEQTPHSSALNLTSVERSNRHKFCAFMPWLFARKYYRTENSVE